jgi:HlyD family secretion protein
MNYEPKFSAFGDNTSTDDAANGTSSTKRWLILLGVAIAAALILFFAWRAMQPSKAGVEGKTAAAGADSKAKQAPKVTVVVPGRQLVENVITSTGSLAAREDMPIGAVGEGGQVLQVLVQPGTWVRGGQVLAIVDRQVQLQQANQLSAQISVAEADARLAQSELERSSALVGRGFVSKADLQRKTATRDSAQARVRVARAQLAEAQARMGRLNIRAPSDGYLLSRNVEPGQVVGAGSGVLFRIARGGRMEFKAELGEADLASMSRGRPALVTPVGTDTVFKGEIFQVSPVINPQTRQGEVRIALPFDRALKPGGFASAKIVAGSAFAPLLPESAVQSDKGINFVMTVDGENKVKRINVKVGSVDEKGASILEGLTGEEKVVVSAGGFLTSGEAVRPELIKK